MKVLNEKVVNRWDKVMYSICVEHETINTNFSELECQKKHYGLEKGITVEWLIKEAKYWLSCYYEDGNIRCEDRYYDKDNYAMWLSETGKLKRLIAMLEKLENGYVALFDEE